jgi:putative tricarboxylic transport membrane protein
MNRDIVCGCITLAIAVVYYLIAAAIPESMLADTVGPQGLPKAYGIALTILSLLLIASGFLAARQVRMAPTGVPYSQASKGDRDAALRAIGMLAIGVGYVVILPWAGYVVSIVLLIIAAAWYQERAYMRWLIPTAIGGAICFWLIFDQLLEIQEPVGFWPSLI